MSSKKKYVLLVFSEPKEGMEEEYNRWYDNTHLPQVTEVPGIVAAQRFKLAERGPRCPARYLSIYEVETDGDPSKVFYEIAARAVSGKIVMSKAINIKATQQWMFGAIGDRLISKT
jgi:hypothetical protein